MKAKVHSNLRLGGRAARGAPCVDCGGDKERPGAQRCDRCGTMRAEVLKTAIRGGHRSIPIGAGQGRQGPGRINEPCVTCGGPKERPRALRCDDCRQLQREAVREASAAHRLPEPQDLESWNGTGRAVDTAPPLTREETVCSHCGGFRDRDAEGWERCLNCGR